jgi:hypothetical protein
MMFCLSSYPARRRSVIMEGLLFLAACIGIGFVAFWVMRNEKANPADPTTGLFAMPSTQPANSTTEDRTGPRRRGRPLSARRKSVPRR